MSNNSKKNNVKKKNLEKEKKKIDNISTESSGSIYKVFVLVCVIIIFLCVFYILAVHITNDKGETTSKKKSEEVSIVYDEIILGRVLSMKDKDYLVILYDKSNSDLNQDISDSVSKYKENNKKAKIYYVDMSEGLNKSYVGDSSNTNPKKASDIVINGPTLIRVKNEKVVDYIESVDSIKEYLN